MSGFIATRRSISFLRAIQPVSVGADGVPGGQPGDVGRKEVLPRDRDTHLEKGTKQHRVRALRARPVHRRHLEADVVDHRLMRSDSWTSLTPSGATLAPRRAVGQLSRALPAGYGARDRRAAPPNAQPEGVIGTQAELPLRPACRAEHHDPQREPAGDARTEPAEPRAHASSLAARHPEKECEHGDPHSSGDGPRDGVVAFQAGSRPTTVPQSSPLRASGLEAGGRFRSLHGMADRAPFPASAGRPADVIAARATRQHSLPGLPCVPPPPSSRSRRRSRSTTSVAPARRGPRPRWIGDWRETVKALVERSFSGVRGQD